MDDPEEVILSTPYGSAAALVQQKRKDLFKLPEVPLSKKAGRPKKKKLEIEDKLALREYRNKIRSKIPDFKRRPKISPKTWEERLSSRPKSTRRAVLRNSHQVEIIKFPVTPAPRTILTLPEESFSPQEMRRGSSKLSGEIAKWAQHFQKEVDEMQRTRPNDYIYWHPTVNPDSKSLDLPEKLTNAIERFNACPCPDPESVIKVRKFNMQLQNWALFMTQAAAIELANELSFNPPDKPSTNKPKGGIFDAGIDSSIQVASPFPFKGFLNTTGGIIYDIISANEFWGPPFPIMTFEDHLAVNVDTVSFDDGKVIARLWDSFYKQDGMKSHGGFTPIEANVLFGTEEGYKYLKDDAIGAFKQKETLPEIIFIPLTYSSRPIVVTVDYFNLDKPELTVYDVLNKKVGPIDRDEELDGMLTRIAKFLVSISTTVDFDIGDVCCPIRIPRLPRHVNYASIVPTFEALQPVDYNLACLVYADYLVQGDFYKAMNSEVSIPSSIAMSMVRTRFNNVLNSSNCF